jgi:hypothetical protein
MLPASECDALAPSRGARTSESQRGELRGRIRRRTCDGSRPQPESAAAHTRARRPSMPSVVEQFVAAKSADPTLRVVSADNRTRSTAIEPRHMQAVPGDRRFSLASKRRETSGGHSLDRADRCARARAAGLLQPRPLLARERRIVAARGASRPGRARAYERATGAYAWSLAQVSLRPSVRLKTSCAGAESGSGQK